LAEVLRNNLVPTFDDEDAPSWEVRDELLDEPASEVRLVLFRVAQQALANVLVHARAERCDVSVLAEDGGISVVVADDGMGVAPTPTRSPATSV
jgi:signal transduction histidine kinase